MTLLSRLKMPGPKGLYLFAVLIGLILGLYSYGREHDFNPLALPEVILQTLYLFLPRPSAFSGADGNPILQAAIFICGTSGFIAAGLIALSALNRSVASLWVQFIKRGHTLVVGSTPFARRLTEVLQQDRTATVQVPDVDGDLAGSPNLISILRRYGFGRAKQIVIDMGEDSDNLMAAKRIRAGLKGIGKSVDIAVQVRDAVMADPVFRKMERDARAEPGDIIAPISVFNDNLLLARHALQSDPLFMRAAARGQDRVHALIIGFGDLGERLMDQVFLTSMAGDLSWPKVTIVDCEATAIHRAFDTRRPHVSESLDITFYEADILHDPIEPMRAEERLPTWVKAGEVQPYTMIYLALPTQADNLKAAILIDGLRRRIGVFAAPIAYRCRLADTEEGLVLDAPSDLTSDEGFIRMVLPAANVVEGIMGISKAERFAAGIHNHYAKTTNASSEAAVPWSELSETYKRSNRWAADHLPAKLWTAGVRPEAMLHATVADKAKLKALIGAPKQDPRFERVARVEHDRWQIDRQLDGWTYSDARDNERRQHHLMIDFDKLPTDPDEAEKDFSQIRYLFELVIEETK